MHEVSLAQAPRKSGPARMSSRRGTLLRGMATPCARIVPQCERTALIASTEPGLQQILSQSTTRSVWLMTCAQSQQTLMSSKSVISMIFLDFQCRCQCLPGFGNRPARSKWGEREAGLRFEERGSKNRARGSWHKILAWHTFLGKSPEASPHPLWTLHPLFYLTSTVAPAGAAAI